MKLITILCGVLASASVFAATPDFSVLAIEKNSPQPGNNKMTDCAHQAWMDAKPTPDQNTAAQAEFDKVKALFTQNKSTIEQDIQAVMAAWQKYPISRSEVIAAETDMGTVIMPIMEAGRDARINVLNLLTADQRNAFDASFKACMQQ